MHIAQDFIILLQNNDFVVIEKPYAMSVHKDTSDYCLTRQLARQLAVDKVWLVHRLDKVTSGILILALTKACAVEFYHMFKLHKISKYYLVLSDATPKHKQGKIIGDMAKSRRGSWKLLRSRENPAITYFKSFSCKPKLRLFLLQPQTGKTHQIRVSMKSLGSPIIGDQLYAGNPLSDRVYLHAYAVAFSYKNKDYQLICPPTSGDLFCLPEVSAQINKLQLFIA